MTLLASQHRTVEEAFSQLEEVRLNETLEGS